MIKKIILALLCAGFGTSLPAQKPAQVLEWMNTVKAGQKNFYCEMPFTFRNNHIVLPVTVGGTTYQYVFDTGGYNDITDAIQEKNNFPVLTTQTVGSTNRLKAKVNIVKVDSIRIGSLTIKDLAMLQMNFDNTPSMQCGVDGGLIGASIIKQFVWQINFKTKTIILTDDIAKLSLDKALKIPVVFNNRLMPFIDVILNGREEKMMFDLGSSTLISLTGKTGGKYGKDRPVIDIKGGAIEGGNGTVQQAIHIIKADSLLIGSMELRNRPIVYTALSNENLIGNPIIKEAIVTLNFKANELYLSPFEKINDGWQSFGFTAAFKDSALRIATLYSGLAGEKAGLQIGDEIVAVNGGKINCSNDCDCKLLFMRVTEKQTILLEIKGSNGNKEIKLTKQTVF
jgi:hypothetical protein